MAEEVRFFLRIALFALAAGTVYWFVSYEWAGTFLFGFVVLGAGFFAAAVAVLVREIRGEALPVRSARRSRLLGAAERTLGFAEQPGDAVPLAVEDEALPPASIWPLVASVSAVLIGLGLVYGPWFWLPGVALGVTTAYGWTTELTR